MKKVKKVLKGFFHILLHGERGDRIAAFAIIFCLISVPSFIIYNNMSPDATKGITTSEMISQIESGNVKELHITPGDGTVNGKLKKTFKNSDGTEVKNFSSTIQTNSETFTARFLDTKNIKYDFSKPSSFVTFLENVLLTIINYAILIGAMLYLLKGSDMGDGMPFNDKEPKVISKIPDSSFDDVVGVPEAIEEVSELVTFLKSPEVYRKAGAEIPHGVLLQGASGVGKTALARALAGEAGVPFISASASEFIELFVGQGAKRVRKLFQTARKYDSAIIFIDEIDAIGEKRGATADTGNEERIQTLNQLLTEMDGFDNSDNIIVIAATNRGDTLDDALLRPGRFDRIITIDLPTKEGRAEILQHYAVGRPFAEPIDFMTLAAHTYGFSGAQLKSVMNQSSTLAARRAIKEGSHAPRITSDDLEEAISRVISGPAMKSRRMNDTERRQVAYHEAGHAVVQYLLPECDDVQKISIVSRNMPGQGAAMGYVQTYSEDDKYIMTAAQCRAQLAALLAGRAAEKHFCNIETAGASDDLKRASSLAYRMFDEYAFTPLDEPDMGSLRVRVVAARKYITSEDRDKILDSEMERELEYAYKTALDIVTSHSDKIAKIVDTLLDNETIDADEIKKIMDGNDDGHTPDGTVPPSDSPDDGATGDSDNESTHRNAQDDVTNVKRNAASINVSVTASSKNNAQQISSAPDETISLDTAQTVFMPKSSIPSFLNAKDANVTSTDTDSAVVNASDNSKSVRTQSEQRMKPKTYDTTANTSIHQSIVDSTVSDETVPMTVEQIRAASPSKKSTPSHFSIDESKIRDESRTMTDAATDALATLDADPSPDETNLSDNGGAWLRMEELQPAVEPTYEQTMRMPQVRTDIDNDGRNGKRKSRKKGGR